MDFGRLSVHFVKKGDRLCTNLRRTPRESIKVLGKSRVNLLVAVPVKHASPAFASSITNVERLAGRLRRQSNRAEKRALRPPRAHDLNVVLDEARRRIDQVARQLLRGRREDQGHYSALDHSLRRR